MRAGTMELILMVLLAAVVLSGIGCWLWKLWKKCKKNKE